MHDGSKNVASDFEMLLWVFYTTINVAIKIVFGRGNFIHKMLYTSKNQLRHSDKRQKFHFYKWKDLKDKFLAFLVIVVLIIR